MKKMKKALTLFAALTLFLTSCVSTRPPEGEKLPAMDSVSETDDAGGVTDLPDTDVGEDSSEDEEPNYFGYGSFGSLAGWTDSEKVMQGIINPDTADARHPRTHLPLYRIDSVESLEKFKADYADVFLLQNDYEFLPCFYERTANMDESFFEEQVLFVTYVMAERETYRYETARVRIEEENFLMEVEQRYDPRVYSDENTGWLAMAELRREDVKDCSVFDAVYVGVDEGSFIQYEYVDPPEMTVVGPCGEIEAIASGAHWWGGEMGMIADSDYPYADDFLDNMNYLPNADFFGEDTVLGRLDFDFSRYPDRIHLSRWRIGDERNHDYRYEVDVSVTAEGITFPLNTSGCYAYSVSASWEKVDNVGGSVSYYFCVGDREGYYDPTCSPQLFIAAKRSEIVARTVEDGWTYPSQDSIGDTQGGSDVLSEYELGNLPLITNESYYTHQAKLIFDYDGEVQLTVRRWNMNAAKYAGFDVAQEEVEVTDGVIELKFAWRDTYVYEVTAVWETVDGVGGKMVYGFCEGPAPIQE